MRFSYLLWFYVSVAAPVSGRKSNRTLDDVIHEERRYVLFNSRRLSGDCLDICVPEETKPPKEPPGLETSPPTNSPTLSPTVKITGDPTASPTNNPTRFPTSSPTNNPTKNPTNNPTKNPTNNPTTVPTASPTNNVVPTSDHDCEDLMNLGYGFSEATSLFPEIEPHAGCFPFVRPAPGWTDFDRDDSVAVFVGNDYIGKDAAEVEGKVVVLGNLKVKKNGPSNFVAVGAGTHVLPNPNTECIIVGGDLEADRDVWVYQERDWMKCDIVYRGDDKKPERWNTNGELRHEPDYDMSFYEQMKEVFIQKSQYWKTLESTPGTSFWTNDGGETKFECTDADEIQVFNFESSADKKALKDGIYSYRFSDNCEGKTILINVHGDGTLKINAVDMYFKDKVGYDEFPTCMTQSILWNFPDAKKVDIGNGWFSEFHGAILTGNPDGELKLATSGHSGKTIVVGDINHDSSSGSEFHSYPYNPPIPLPDPEGICDLTPSANYSTLGVVDTGVGDVSIGSRDGGSASSDGGSASSDGGSASSDSGSASSDSEPSSDIEGCVPIPQDRLPHGSWSTTAGECDKCSFENMSIHWPCDLPVHICEGECWHVGDPFPPYPAPEDIEGCQAIPQYRLPAGISETEDTQCQNCANGQTWWPCGLDPPLCEGRDC